MEEIGKNEREEIFSSVMKAGKRTYFFDVKSTKSGEKYLTITESKKKFDNENGKFYYEKHKIFLYKEDFDKFTKTLGGVMNFIETGELPEVDAENGFDSDFSNVDFDHIEKSKE
jgi:hypothetical protein